MEMEDQRQPAATEAASSRRRRVGALLITLGVLAVLLLSGGLALASSHRHASAHARTFAVQGQLIIKTTETTIPGINSPCDGLRRPDLHSGAAVTVSSAGTTLATGTLGVGTETVSTTGGVCVFPFAVANVPAGKKVYEVQIGRHAPVQVSEADLPKAVLTIGV
jgi:hypothetical protein